MGYITKVMFVGTGLQKNIQHINNWLTRKGHKPMTEVGKYVDTDKKFGNLCVGAFNFLPVENFCDFLFTLEWEANCYLFIKRESSEWKKISIYEESDFCIEAFPIPEEKLETYKRQSKQKL